jgi:hypothetical protein
MTGRLFLVGNNLDAANEAKFRDDFWHLIKYSWQTSNIQGAWQVLKYLCIKIALSHAPLVHIQYEQISAASLLWLPAGSNHLAYSYELTMVLGAECYGYWDAVLFEMESELRGFQETHASHLLFFQIKVGKEQGVVASQQGPWGATPVKQPEPCTLLVCIPCIGEDI